MNKKWLFVALFLAFLASRTYILKNPPLNYSDVSHDYERYANMWQYGLPPYLKHYYEYPPATVPLLWLPLVIDLAGVGRYYSNYRIGIFWIDLALFILILRILKRIPSEKNTKILSVLFYLAAPVIAKDFFYEGIDLAFAAALLFSISFLLLSSYKKIFCRIFFWAFFWLSTALKFMSAPLLVPLFNLRKLPFKKELFCLIMGFFLVWGIPLAIFRTSLSVSFVFHAKRPLKYASFASHIIETVNFFTHSETRVDEPPDFQFKGPVSQKMTRLSSIVFPISIFLILYYSLAIIFKKWQPLYILKQAFPKNLNFDSHIHPFVFALKITLIFIFTLFLTGKIFSQPFHIWYLPLLAVFPFKDIKQQIKFILPALWLLVVDTTPWIRIGQFTAPFAANFLTYFYRFLPMVLLLYFSFKLPDNMNNHKGEPLLEH